MHIVKRSFIGLLFFSFTSQLSATITLLSKGHYADLNSHHLQTFHHAALETHFHNLYQSKWELKFTPNVFRDEFGDYFTNIDNAFIKRPLGRRMSVLLGKDDFWIHDEMTTLAGAKVSLFDLDLQRVLELQSGHLFKADLIREHQVGRMVSLDYKDRKLLKNISLFVRAFIFENREDEHSHLGSESSFSFTPHPKWSLHLSTQQYGKDNWGYATSVHFLHSYLQLQKTLKEEMLDDELDYMVLKTFTTNDIHWLNIGIDEWNHLFQLKFNYNLDQTKQYEGMLATTISHWTPFIRYARVDFEENLEYGQKFDLWGRSHLSMGRGSKNSRRISWVEDYLFGDISLIQRLGNHQIKLKLSYLDNDDWMKDDVVATLHYTYTL